jgi:hypothetical protein
MAHEHTDPRLSTEIIKGQEEGQTQQPAPLLLPLACTTRGSPRLLSLWCACLHLVLAQTVCICAH